MDRYLIRKADEKDLNSIEMIYDRIHDAEESGKLTTEWIRGIYPVRCTAQEAIRREDMYVLEKEKRVLAAAIINRVQGDIYAQGSWKFPAESEKVCVLHTLAVLPEEAGKGYGQAMIRFYESLAEKTGCTELRLDTNEKNLAARTLYQKMGYQEAGILPTVFNGIPDVRLVLLEKQI